MEALGNILGWFIGGKLADLGLSIVDKLLGYVVWILFIWVLAGISLTLILLITSEKYDSFRENLARKLSIFIDKINTLSFYYQDKRVENKWLSYLRKLFSVVLSTFAYLIYLVENAIKCNICFSFWVNFFWVSIPFYYLFTKYLEVSKYVVFSILYSTVSISFISAVLTIIIYHFIKILESKYP
jgi:hypothetical protein